MRNTGLQKKEFFQFAVGAAAISAISVIFTLWRVIHLMKKHSMTGAMKRMESADDVKQITSFKLKKRPSQYRISLSQHDLNIKDPESELKESTSVTETKTSLEFLSTQEKNFLRTTLQSENLLFELAIRGREARAQLNKDYDQLLEKYSQHTELKGTTFVYRQICSNLENQIKWTFTEILQNPLSNGPYFINFFFLKLKIFFETRDIRERMLKKVNTSTLLHKELSEIKTIGFKVIDIIKFGLRFFALGLQFFPIVGSLFLLLTTSVVVPPALVSFYLLRSKFFLIDIGYILNIFLQHWINPLENSESDAQYIQVIKNNQKVFKQCFQYVKQHNDNELQFKLQKETKTIFRQELNKLSKKEEYSSDNHELKEDNYEKILFAMIPLQSKLLEMDTALIQIIGDKNELFAELKIYRFYKAISQIKESFNKYIQESLELKKNPPSEPLEKILKELTMMEETFKVKFKVALFYEPQLSESTEKSDIFVILSKIDARLSLLHEITSQLSKDFMNKPDHFCYSLT